MLDLLLSEVGRRRVARQTKKAQAVASIRMAGTGHADTSGAGSGWLGRLVRKATARERGEARAELRETLDLRAGRATLAGQRIDTA